MDTTVSSGVRRCAVIYNPTKVSDEFRGLVTDALTADSWADTLWLETTESDPGRAMTKQSVGAGVDLVIGAGGDGTIRVIADGLAHTEIPLGLVPAGTGNLLARNLELPLNEAEAVAIALSGQPKPIDLIALTVDDQPVQHFAVMGGVGIDAMIMDETDPNLKEKVGSAAYFLAAGKALGRLPMRATIAIEGHRPVRRKTMLIIIGNVGQLTGNITVLPDARPDDGRLDVFIASPRTPLDWVKVVLRIITRRGVKGDKIDTTAAQRVTITLDQPDDYQLDGDVAGSGTVLKAEVKPGALLVCLPR